MILAVAGKYLPVVLCSIRQRIGCESHLSLTFTYQHRVGIFDVSSLLSHFIIGPDEVRAFTRGGPLNTDDNARIEFSSPKTLFTSFHVEIQQLMIESSGGIAGYLINHGKTKEEQADFIAAIAEAAMDQSDSLEGLARTFARDSARLDPKGRGAMILEALE